MNPEMCVRERSLSSRIKRTLQLFKIGPKKTCGIKWTSVHHRGYFLWSNENTILSFSDNVDSGHLENLVSNSSLGGKTKRLLPNRHSATQRPALERAEDDCPRSCRSIQKIIFRYNEACMFKVVHRVNTVFKSKYANKHCKIYKILGSKSVKIYYFFVKFVLFSGVKGVHCFISGEKKNAFSTIFSPI